MKKACLLIIYLLEVMQSYSQVINEKKKDSLDKVERRENIYINRKYSFNVSLSPYTNISHGSNNDIFGAFDITFSDRFRWLDVGKNASLEGNFGIGFEPYQGTKLNFGCNYELLSKKYRTNLYVGWEYSLGLPQATSLEDNSSVKVGFHNYLMPLIGFMWWPRKDDKIDRSDDEKYRYLHPGFRQLFYFKLQIGYAFLLNKVSVDTTGIFDSHLYGVIRNNTANTLNVRICIGINIPTFGKKRDKYFNFLNNLR